MCVYIEVLLIFRKYTCCGKHRKIENIMDENCARGALIECVLMTKKRERERDCEKSDLMHI